MNSIFIADSANHKWQTNLLGTWHFSSLYTRGKRGSPDADNNTDKDTLRFCTSDYEFDGDSTAEHHITGRSDHFHTNYFLRL